MVRSLHSVSPPQDDASPERPSFAVQAIWRQDGSQDFATPESYVDDYSSAKFEVEQLKRKVAHKRSASVILFKRARGDSHWGPREVLEEQDLDPYYAAHPIIPESEVSIAA